VIVLSLFLRAARVAEILGLSDQTVVAMCKRGELKHIKMGKQYLIDKEALEDLIGKKVEGGEEHNE
jgi:excisionase family DNA binding protein